MDVTHSYSKRIDGTAPFLGKLPPNSNPFLFLLRVILENQAPLFGGREPVETLVKTG